jgi:hypothetical protein
MAKHTRHYVDFRSPGSFVAEESSRPIERLDTRAAVQMAKSVKERYGATPYAFRFRTMLEADPVTIDGEVFEVVPKQAARSGEHFIGADVVSYDQVPDTERNNILRGNMRCNGYPFVAQRPGGGWTQPFDADAVCVHAESGDIIRRGDDPDVAKYRAEKLKEWGRD